MAIDLNRKTIKTIIASIAFTFGLLLLSINIYGLFADIRKPNLDQVNPEKLRFINNDYLSYSDSIEKLKAIEHESQSEYAQKANRLVQQSLTHIKWNKVDPGEFRQLVPIWENYLLYIIGIFSDQPQIKRYHFINYKRSLERGIGICGDASMVLSQILDKKGIDNRIVSYRGHVITEITIADNKKILLDPDFGVEINMSVEDLSADPGSAYTYYLNAGYSEKEARSLVNIYGGNHILYEDVFAFMPKRYVFEYLSYVLKWLIPVCLLVLSFLIFRSNQKHTHPAFN